MDEEIKEEFKFIIHCIECQYIDKIGNKILIKYAMLTHYQNGITYIDNNGNCIFIDYNQLS